MCPATTCPATAFPANPLQDLFGGGLLSQVSAAVNFTDSFPDVPSAEIFSAAEDFTMDLLELDLEFDREDIAGICGCIRTVAALSMGQGLVHAAAAAAADAAQLSCSSSSSSAVAPMQLYSWAHRYAAAAAAGRFDGKLQAKAAADGAAATSTPSRSSSSAGRVIAAAADGGLVAYCCPQQQQQQQQGWGVYLPPGAPDAPLLTTVSTRVLPIAAAGSSSSSSSIVLQLQGRNINLQQHTLLVKCRRQLHSLPLLPAAAAAAGCYTVEVPGVLLQQPGVLLLSVATQQHFVSGSQAVLLLPCEQAVADELNDM
jgi:hypothetical protein